MKDTILAPILLKTDRRGHVRMPKERREALLDEYERSGMTGKAFAGHYGIKYQTLACWLQKRRKAHRGKMAQPGRVQLVEAVMEAGYLEGKERPTSLRICLPGGAMLELADERQAVLAAYLLRALARSC